MTLAPILSSSSQPNDPGDHPHRADAVCLASLCARPWWRQLHDRIYEQETEDSRENRNLYRPLLGGGKKKSSGKIDIAVMQSLSRQENLDRTAGPVRAGHRR